MAIRPPNARPLPLDANADLNIGDAELLWTGHAVAVWGRQESAGPFECERRSDSGVTRFPSMQTPTSHCRVQLARSVARWIVTGDEEGGSHGRDRVEPGSQT